MISSQFIQMSLGGTDTLMYATQEVYILCSQSAFCALRIGISAIVSTQCSSENIRRAVQIMRLLYATWISDSNAFKSHASFSWFARAVIAQSV
jgi:hypothetical protein